MSALSIPEFCFWIRHGVNNLTIPRSGDGKGSGLNMRTSNSNHDAPSVRTGTGKGRAVLVGYGLDDAAGHTRYTRSNGYELYGGSETTHSAMQAKARKIQEELANLGYSLDSITCDQLEEVRRIVERISAE